MPKFSEGIKMADVVNTANREKAKEYLQIFQTRLILNATASPLFKTKLIDSTNNGIYDLSTLNSPVPGLSLLQAILFGNLVEYNPNIPEDAKTIRILKNLFLANTSYKKESGSNATYVGWPFCFGTNAPILPPQPKEDGSLPTEEEYTAEYSTKTFCGPLLLWKIKISVDEHSNIVTVQIATDDEGKPLITLNPEIIVRSLVQHKNLNISPELKIDFDASNLQKFVDSIVASYSQTGFQITVEEQNRLVEILSNFAYTQYQYIDTLQIAPQLNGQDFLLIENAVIGFYKQSSASGSLFFDYNKMLETDGPDYMSDLHNHITDTLKLSKLEGTEFPEGFVKEIIPLDYSQKNAARISINSSLVVQGPPGTGKSQTISNIIANYMYLCRSCLFVTEKKTAAGVVYNRLNRLRAYCLKFYDAEADANDFTRQVKLGLGRIRQLYGASAITDETIILDHSSRRIDEIFKELNSFKLAMHSEQGNKFPKFIVKFNEEKESIYAGLDYVRNIIPSFDNQRDFWSFIKKTVDDSQTFTTLTGIKNSFNLTDDQFGKLMDLAILYDGTSDNVVRAIPYYLKHGEILDDIDEMYSEVKPRRYKNNPDYIALAAAFAKIDEFSIYTLCLKEKDWFNKFSVFVQQEIYTKIIEFNKKFNAENFDFKTARELPNVINFLNQNASEIMMDGQSPQQELRDLFDDKQRDDLIACETNFIKSIIKILTANRDLYDQFNSLYAYINSVDVVHSIKSILTKYNAVISLCFPVIISSPQAASQLLPTRRGLFDHVVIDEASQLSIEKAIPIIYRGKRFCVLGDRKQTPPTDIEENVNIQPESLKSSTTIDDKLEWELLSGVKSLIDYAMQKVQCTTLDYHYRATKKELINFSNNVFYNGRLNICDSPYKTKNGLKLVNVNGKYVDGINVVEADTIIAHITRLCNTPDHGSIGVITITQEQCDYIKEKLMASHSRYVINELTKINHETGEDISLFVKTIEDVQGEERDNIFISIGWSRGPTGKVNNNFGVIKKPYGANHVNVAISRSKYNMTILKSFESHDIDTDNDGVLILKEFLEYTEILDKVKDVNAPEIENMFVKYTKDTILLNADMSEKGSEWLAREIGEELEPKLPKKYKCVYGHHEGSFKVGITIQSTTDKSYVVGIITDEFDFDPTIPGKERDFYSQNFLELKGWKFIRVSAIQWAQKTNRDVIIRNLLAFLDYQIQLLGNTNKELTGQAKVNTHSLKLEPIPVTFGFFEKDSERKARLEKGQDNVLSLDLANAKPVDLGEGIDILSLDNLDGTAPAAAPAVAPVSIPEVSVEPASIPTAPAVAPAAKAPATTKTVAKKKVATKAAPKNKKPTTKKVVKSKKGVNK